MKKLSHSSRRPNPLQSAIKRRRAFLEPLETRRLLTVLSTFELDGNAVTGVLGATGSTTVSHDWDQVYADNQTTPAGTTSAAVASSFVTDKVNSNTDDIFTGGGSKDTLGIQ